MKNKNINKKRVNKNLQKKILKMAEIDQKLRKSGEFNFKKMRKIDKKNTKEMKKIIKERGWPGKSLVGAKASASAFLLVQHADYDLNFQKMCLSLIKQAVKRNDTSKWQIAYLTDRILMNQKNKQIYGTQFSFDKKLEKVIPYPIKNKKRFNELRKSFGLEPFEKYKKKVEKNTRILLKLKKKLSQKR